MIPPDTTSSSKEPEVTEIQVAPQEHREKGNKDEAMETEYTCIVVPYRDEETAISLLKTTNVNEESKGRQLLSNEKSNNVDLSSVECTKSVQEPPQNQRLIKSTTACLQGSRCDQMLTRSIPARAVAVAEEVLENEMMRTDIVASTEGFEDVYLPGATTQGAILDLRNVLEHDNTFDLPTNLLEKGRVFPGDSHHNESSATSIENDGNASEHSKDSEILKQIRYYFPYILLLGALLCLTVGLAVYFSPKDTADHLGYGSAEPTMAPSEIATIDNKPSTTQGPNWLQVGEAIHGPRPGDTFGEAIAMSADGNRIAVGVESFDGSSRMHDNGLVRVYEQNKFGNWVQLGLSLFGNGNGDLFGHSVSISGDGNRIAVGSVKIDNNDDPIYDSSSNIGLADWEILNTNADLADWELLDTNDDIIDRVGDNAGSEFGEGHAIEGILSSTNLNLGRVQIFEYQSEEWVLVGNPIVGEKVGEMAAKSVVLSYSGHRVAIGAHETNSGRGRVRVYELISKEWEQIGGDIEGQTEGDCFGNVLSLSRKGNNIAIGSPFDSNFGVKTGHVRVFEYRNNIWKQIGQTLGEEVTDDKCGSTVSLSDDGKVVAVGTPAGYVQIYDYLEGAKKNVWIEIGKLTSDLNSKDFSSPKVSLSFDGKTIAIGRSNFDSEKGVISGSVRIFKHDETSLEWMQAGSNIDGERKYSHFGESVSLSADGCRVAIGSVGNELNGKNSGNLRLFDLSECRISL